MPFKLKTLSLYKLLSQDCIESQTFTIKGLKNALYYNLTGKTLLNTIHWKLIKSFIDEYKLYFNKKNMPATRLLF